MENKTKIFQIGIDRLTIIDTDGPGVLDVKFSRVSRCVQGIKYPACFGFVAREPKRQRNAKQQTNGGTNGVGVNTGPDFSFHIFQCFDEQTVSCGCVDMFGYTGNTQKFLKEQTKNKNIQAIFVCSYRQHPL